MLKVVTYKVHHLITKIWSMKCVLHLDDVKSIQLLMNTKFTNSILTLGRLIFLIRSTATKGIARCNHKACVIRPKQTLLLTTKEIVGVNQRLYENSDTVLRNDVIIIINNFVKVTIPLHIRQLPIVC